MAVEATRSLMTTINVSQAYWQDCDGDTYYIYGFSMRQCFANNHYLQYFDVPQNI